MKNSQLRFLKETIDQNPEFWLGGDSVRGDLPFLLKVLSVGQALSIQAHPNKKLAEQLHRRSPEVYPDDNHKPEICIPLGDFEALVGFRPLEEIRKYVIEVPELQQLCCKGSDPGSLGLREMYSELMRSEPMIVAQQIASLIRRLRGKTARTPEEDLILTVEKDYPGDVGIFSVFFLNYVRITSDMPSQYIYCAPDEPHAYLKGDAVECMAISDNVVRAGLTAKHKDVETLLDMLTYRDDMLPQLVGSGDRVAPNVLKYDPPVEDFVVYEIDGPVPEGLHLPHAAITTCISGTFDANFRFGDGLDYSSPDWSISGPQHFEMGHTFFSRAGSNLVVENMPVAGKLFVATY